MSDPRKLNGKIVCVLLDQTERFRHFEELVAPDARSLASQSNDFRLDFEHAFVQRRAAIRAGGASALDRRHDMSTSERSLSVAGSESFTRVVVVSVVSVVGARVGTT